MVSPEYSKNLGAVPRTVIRPVGPIANFPITRLRADLSVLEKLLLKLSKGCSSGDGDTALESGEWS
jgi:hypothetical protein